jgi:hypothetical protein
MALVGTRGVVRMDTATTPGRLRLLLALLVAGSLGWGVLAALTADQHASAASNVVSVSEPLSLDAEQIYQSLSDADATAAGAFLSGGLEPATARQRYNADIAQASVRIEAATARVGASAARTQVPGRLSTQSASASTATGDDLATLTAGLPVYTGEVDSAQADNRLGLPLGAAYLREASGLLRGQLLSAANDIYDRENGLLTSASAQATGLPLMIIAIIVGAGACYLLIRSGRWLTRRTHRVINVGVLIATITAIVSVAWLTGAYLAGRAELLNAQQHGSSVAEAFARADVAALRAHADESLTLIDNTGDDAYQADYLKQYSQLTKLLAGVHGQSQAAAAMADAQAWKNAHAALRALDDGGSHASAVASASAGPASAAFAKLSRDLSAGIIAGQAAFDSHARSGRDAFTGLTIGMIVASLVMAAGCTAGLNRRLAEYR